MKFYYSLNNDQKTMQVLGNYSTFPEAYENAHKIQVLCAAKVLSLYLPKSHVRIFQDDVGCSDLSRLRLIRTMEIQPAISVTPFVSPQKQAYHFASRQLLRKVG